MKFIVRNEDVRAFALEFIRSMDIEKPQQVEIRPWTKRRSLNQNAFLHAVPLKLISEHTGYEVDELKEFLMGECFGWQDKDVLGHKVSRPIKTTSELSTEEFNSFLDWIERWAVQTLGMIIPKPNEYLT